MTAARRPEEGDREAAGAKRQEPIRVLIADDHALFRRGLEMVLEEEDDIDLVGQASDGTEAVTVAGAGSQTTCSTSGSYAQLLP